MACVVCENSSRTYWSICASLYVFGMSMWHEEAVSDMNMYVCLLFVVHDSCDM